MNDLMSFSTFLTFLILELLMKDYAIVKPVLNQMPDPSRDRPIRISIWKQNKRNYEK